MVYIGAISFTLAAISYFALSLLLLTSWRGKRLGGILTAACLLSAVWAAALAVDAARHSFPPILVFIVEMIRSGAWLTFLVFLASQIGIGRKYLVLTHLAWIGTLTAGLVMWFGQPTFGPPIDLGKVFFPGGLFIALIGLILIEQLYRNSAEELRWGLKPLAVGIGGIFAYDLFLFSQAVLLGAIDTNTWMARGAVNMLFVPLIAIAVRRNPDWDINIFVSRHVVFYSTSLVAVGLYLLLMSIGGYALVLYGGTWGGLAQIVFFVGAGIVLSILLFSTTLRARSKVFLNKHFFRNKYDYREEWLRLTDTLTSDDEELPLAIRGIKAIGQILGCPSGVMWVVDNQSNGYCCTDGWNAPHTGEVLLPGSSLVDFLADSGWVIEMREYKDNPDLYADLALDPAKLGVADPAFIIPLVHVRRLVGFVVLSATSMPVTLNYEDRDLLRTAGQQIASYLAQDISTEQLAEARQFEAFNKLTAYLMHDLKNVVAQQSLVVANAQKHKGNPAFFDDAMDTIENSVARIRRVIEHIQQAPKGPRLEKVELGKLIMQAVSQCASGEPVPRAIVGDSPIWILGDRERLQMAVYHAIRNAQDATTSDGSVTVDLHSQESSCAIRITDTGCGMDEQFVRERLFKPFESTKGTQGMGIGAYQLRETVRGSNGEVRVVSTPGQGTTVILAFDEIG